MNDAVRHRCPVLSHIPESSYIALQRGTADQFDLNYTMDLKQISHPKHRDKMIGRAVPYGGMAALKTNGKRIQVALKSVARFAKGVKSILEWHNPLRSTAAVWFWSFLLFYPDLIMPSVVAAVLIYMGNQGFRHYRQREKHLFRGSTIIHDENDIVDAGTTDHDDEQDSGNRPKREWEAWEERRLWKVAHAPGALWLSASNLTQSYVLYAY